MEGTTFGATRVESWEGDIIKQSPLEHQERIGRIGAETDEPLHGPSKPCCLPLPSYFNEINATDADTLSCSQAHI